MDFTEIDTRPYEWIHKAKPGPDAKGVWLFEDADSGEELHFLISFAQACTQLRARHAGRTWLLMPSDD